MEHEVVKRLPTTEVKTHCGRIVYEVATMGMPVVRTLRSPWDKTPERR